MLPVIFLRREKPCLAPIWESTSVFMLATSTWEGHSLLHALQPTHRSKTSFIRSPVSSSGGRVPSRTERKTFARARVVSFSSSVTMYEGHIVPPFFLRQNPEPLHSSTAAANPPCEEKFRFVASGSRLRPGPIRSWRSIFGGSTITLGFNNPFGSQALLTSPKARTISSPYIRSKNSERLKPSPCSPETE